MKHQLDPGTAEMPLAARRGRGRPRKPDSLTPAERAKRYRAKRVMVPLDCLGVSDSQYDDLVRENENLRAELVALQAQFAALIA